MNQAKEITKKLYNNILNSIKLQYKNGYYIYDSGNSKISKPYRLLVNLINLKININKLIKLKINLKKKE